VTKVSKTLIEDSKYDELTLECPVCGYPNAHIREVQKNAGLAEFRDYGDAAIVVECEAEGHLYAVVVGDHKGDCILSAVVVDERTRRQRSSDDLYAVMQSQDFPRSASGATKADLYRVAQRLRFGDEGQER
jgi:hypothetical protein